MATKKSIMFTAIPSHRCSNCGFMTWTEEAECDLCRLDPEYREKAKLA